MPQDIGVEDLVAKQQEMSKLALTAQSVTDSHRMQAIATELQRLGQELEAMAAQMAAQLHGTGTAPPRSGTIEVMLTPEQQVRVREATGVELESIRIPDPTGSSVHSMPMTPPAVIEQRALVEAQRRKSAAAAEAEARAQLQATFAIIESQGTPALRQQLDEIRRDPKFLGGLLQKKE